MRRLYLGLTQQRLASDVGLTYQSLQQYERGGNRISASKLHALAGVLQVPITYFFEGLKCPGGGEPSAMDEMVVNFLASAEGLDLAAAFVRISSGPTRRRLVRLAQAIADDEVAALLVKGDDGEATRVQDLPPQSRQFE